MSNYIITLLLALSSIFALADESSECSNWYYRPPGSNHCKCGQSLSGGVMCSEGEVYLRVDYTMTRDKDTNETVVALGVYGYDNYTTIKDRVYTLVPNDSQDLNEAICLPNNRMGFLCEDCIDDFGPTAYSPKCENCTKRSTAERVALLLTLKLLPITVMFFVLVIFQINITQGPTFGYAIYCQGYTRTVGSVMAFYELILHQHDSYRWIANTSLFLSAFWDMDYSPLFGSFCISQSLNSHDIILLNFISVLYPLVLMVLTYLCFNIHTKNIWPVSVMCKPCSRIYSKLRRNFSATDSIIHAYATLLLLSFSTLNYNAFQLLRTTNVYSRTTTQYVGVLFLRPSIHIHSLTYLLYFLVVLVFMLFLGVLPTLLLCIYSVKLFRRKLANCFSQRVQIALTIFVDTFQGTFKDGLNGTRDYRSLPAVFALSVMLSAIVAAIVHTISLSLIPVSTVILVLASILTAWTRPCKTSSTNISLSFHMVWMAAIAILLEHYILDNGEINTTPAVLLAVALPVPHILMLIWVAYNILHRINCLKLTCKRIARLKRDSSENLIPDRLENSQNYRELSTTDYKSI